MVLGTPTTGMPSSFSRAATPSVSSPPITTSASTPRPARLSLIRSTPVRPGPVSLNGLVRDEPRIVPPRGRMPRTALTSSGIVSASSGPRQPSRKPTNSSPYSWIPLRTTARITAFRPGQSPPPVRTPTRIGQSLAVRKSCNGGSREQRCVGNSDDWRPPGPSPGSAPRGAALLPQPLLRLLRVDVDVLLAGQLRDLGHDLVGDRAQRLAVRLPAVVAGELHRLAEDHPRPDRRTSGCASRAAGTRRCRIIAHGTTGARDSSASRATPVCPGTAARPVSGCPPGRCRGRSPPPGRAARSAAPARWPRRRSGRSGSARRR